ncbi:MarR family transcriptional regulator [Clostridium bowmanii]|uniref:MarR family winged helix-turn-helix transcriptional regulator n=1 Tax=Clostridium bowmanii TaxID=132925 RepID=UPI001C0D9CD4|nr:MarR family transcriptional regulator [Clostridium bowmanii]MBU3191371.1 MarR family transcriptional regulator [Clostridium bowmanii]MCA1075784.1 MarR family transcriptional regulator [Clostridium bowmanii]
MENKYIDGIFDELISVFPIFTKRIFEISDNTTRNNGIARAHVNLMRFLKIEGACTMTDLGKMLYVSKPNITVLVNKLVEFHMVKRMLDKNDRRIIYIELTDIGCICLEKHTEAMKIAFSKSMQKFSIDDLTLLKETLNNMKIIVEKMEE